MTNTAPVHISVLLDRSGSMSAIADDVIGGFNVFLAEQKEQSGQGRVTLIQFDGDAPFEVIIDGTDLTTVGDLDPKRYLPRGTTPLFDAVGLTVSRVDTAILERADEGLPIEDQVVVIITDGHENASREFSGRVIRDLIRSRRELGWTFVFMGATEAGLNESMAMGVAAFSSAPWAATAQGSREAFTRLSKETSQFRSMRSDERRSKSDKFFDEEDK